MDAVDLMESTSNRQKFTLSYPAVSTSVGFSDIINPSNVVLTHKDVRHSFNQLNNIAFRKSSNSALNEDIVINADSVHTIDIALPYVKDVTGLIPEINSTGSYVFINNRQWKEGDKVDFSTTTSIKIVAFNGDIQTYDINISKSTLPYVELSCPASQAIGKEWISNTYLAIDGKEIAQTSIKGKGSHYAENLKNNFALKFENKTNLLGITKNKRWLLLSNEADKTLFRAEIGYWISAKLANDAWTPATKPINLSINGQYAGCYSLIEQPRICKGRLDNGYLISIDQEADMDDDKFMSTISNTLFIMEDPETGVKGTGLIQAKDKIDKLEKAIAKEDWATVGKIADLNSFANWLVVNEIAKNSTAFHSDTYIHITGDGIISLTPIWDLKKGFGCEDNATAGWTACTTAWIQPLLKNEDFLKTVKQQFAKVYGMKNELLDYITQETKARREAAIANNTLWHNLSAERYGNEAGSAYDKETELLRNWLENRLEWLNNEWK